MTQIRTIEADVENMQQQIREHQRGKHTEKTKQKTTLLVHWYTEKPNPVK